ncbi:hypothetical protein LXL04_036089 [Taraxacum kok-saghyz]
MTSDLRLVKCMTGTYLSGILPCNAGDGLDGESTEGSQHSPPAMDEFALPKSLKPKDFAVWLERGRFDIRILESGSDHVSGQILRQVLVQRVQIKLLPSRYSGAFAPGYHNGRSEVTVLAAFLGAAFFFPNPNLAETLPELECRSGRRVPMKEEAAAAAVVAIGGGGLCVVGEECGVMYRVGGQMHLNITITITYIFFLSVCRAVNELNVRRTVREPFGGKFVYVRLFNKRTDTNNALVCLLMFVNVRICSFNYRAVQMRTIIGFENGGTNLGHLFHFAADQFSVAGALPSVHRM